MAREPNADFIRQFDTVLTDVLNDAPACQRLQPRLSEFSADVAPEQAGLDALDVLGWLARDPAMVLSNETSGAGYILLRSQVAMSRCALLSHDADNDRLVRASMSELLTLSSGPYGGSTIALQRCAELGLLAPVAFFNATTRHLYDSPAGFRVLRALARFAAIGRRRDETDASISQQLTTLLRQLIGEVGHERFVDPYPGAEWGLALARERIRARENQLDHRAMKWLKATVDEADGSARERAYAALVLIETVARKPTSKLARDVVAALDASDSSLLSGWAQLFERWGHHRDAADLQEAADLVFEPTRRAVRDATRLVLAERADLRQLEGALESVIFAALVTADGRWRRHLVESLVAAGLVDPTATILLRVLASERDYGIRESAVFLLSRLREPREDVLDLLTRATDESGSHHTVVQAALWAIGDVFHSSASQHADAFSLLLMRAAMSSRPQPLVDERLRLAAAHALAVMGRHIPKAKEGTTDVHSQALHKLAVGGRVSRVDAKVARLGEWGWLLRSQSGVVDPFRTAGLHPGASPRTTTSVSSTAEKTL